jgi:hypothetical protein
MVNPQPFKYKNKLTKHSQLHAFQIQVETAQSSANLKPFKYR